MKMLTKQEIFDKAGTHLLTQKVKSINEDTGSCKYRGPKGRKCAIGAFISDLHYDKKMEGRDSLGLFLDYPSAMYASGLSKDHVTFLNHLQSVHDSGEPHKWEALLNNLAKEFKLEPLGTS